MGFSEFQRLTRQISSHYMGVDSDTEDEYGEVEHAEERAKRRWQQSVKRVVLLNRFLAASREARQQNWFRKVFVKRGAIILVNQIFAIPLQFSRRLFVGKSLFPSNPLSVIWQNLPLFVCNAILDETSNMVQKNAEKTEKGVPFFEIFSLLTNSILFSPILMGLTRTLVLGKSLGRLFHTSNVFAWWNTLGVHLATDGTVKFLEWLPSTKTSSIFSDIASLVAMFVCGVIDAKADVRLPDSDFPDCVNILDVCTDIYKSEGILGFFTGLPLGSMFLITGGILSAGAANLAASYLNGRERRVYLNEVSRARELLELNKGRVVEPHDESHLETLLHIVGERKLSVILVLHHRSRTYESTEHFARTLAEKHNLAVLLCDPKKIPSVEMFDDTPHLNSMVDTVGGIRCVAIVDGEVCEGDAPWKLYS